MSSPSPGRFARFLRALERPRAFPAVVVLAAVLALPTLAMGFYSDDYGMLAQIEHTFPRMRGSTFDLYRFIGNAPGELAEDVRLGPVPWFADPGLKIHFLRPLSSALLSLDHAVWGRFAAGWHLTGVLLYAALALAVGLFYRRLLDVRGAGPGQHTGARPGEPGYAPNPGRRSGLRPGEPGYAPNPGQRSGLRPGEPGYAPNPAATTATLAALIFAADEAHLQVAAWPSSHHLAVALVPSALALAAHVRFVRDGWRPGAFLGPLGLAIGLLGGEAALGAVAYWLAFDLLGPAPPAAGASSRRARLRASLPALAITAAWTAYYKARGYGAAGNGCYLDPAASPRDFAIAALDRVPALLGELFTGLPSDLMNPFPSHLYAVVGLVATAAMFALHRLVRPAIPGDEQAALRWLLPGALVSLVLASGGFIGGRLLLFASVGGAFFLAVLLHRGTERLASLAGGARLALGAGRGLLVVVHLVLAPFLFATGPSMFADYARKQLDIARRAELDGPAPRRVVVIAASDPFAAMYPATTLALVAPETAVSWNILSMAKHAHRVTRTGPASFRLDVVGGRMMKAAFEQVFRSPHTPFHVGDRVELEGATVTVAAVEADAPTAIDVRFDVPLEDPHLYLLTWRDGRLARLAPPRVGETIDLPWSPGPLGFF